MLQSIRSRLAVRTRLRRLLPDAAAVSPDHFRAYGKIPNLKSPRTFSEKVQYRKIYCQTQRMSTAADKVLVKDLVRAALGDDWVIPTIWSGTKLPPKALRVWIPPYVIKANNGSGSNIFVRNKTDENWNYIDSLCRQWLHTCYGKALRENIYSTIRPQIIVEPYIGDVSTLPLDYKFYVFSGRVEFVHVDTDRELSHKRVFFDRDWRKLPFTYTFPAGNNEIPRPPTLEKMISAAEKLGSDFDFVRVDLYEIDGRPYFGEMTFLPDSGLGAFNPPDTNRSWGEYWKMTPKAGC